MPPLHRRASYRRGLTRATLLVAMVSCAAPATLLLAPRAAVAQSDDIARAQKHYEKGVEWYAASEYPKAIVEFLKGYNLAPNAMFLYNISLSYEKMENYEEALKAALRARGEEGFPAGYETRNAARIAAFRRIVEAQETAPRIKRAAEQQLVEKDPDDGADDKVTPPTPAPPADSSFGALGWTGVATAAAGGGALIGMALINAGLESDVATLETMASEGKDRDGFEGLRADTQSTQNTGKILMYAGSGLVGLGVLLIGIDLLTGGEESPASALRFGRTDGGFTVGHGFRF